jgi:hypothetical protein
MSTALNTRSAGSVIRPRKARGMLLARNNLIGYLLEIAETGGSLPAGRSSCGVSLTQIAHYAGISVRSAQRMRPLIGRWANTLRAPSAASRGDH